MAHRLARVGLCIAGYGVACVLAAATVWLKNLRVNPEEMMASSGMYAFADVITFIAVFAVALVLSSIGLLCVLNFGPAFWRAYAVLGLLLASSGLMAAMVLFPRTGAQPSLLGTVQMFAVLRVLSAPLSFLLLVPGAFLARESARRRLLLACALELTAVCAFVVRTAMLM